VFKGIEFNIESCLLYFTFNSKIYAEVWKDGKMEMREERKIVFPLGIWVVKYPDAIWKSTEYKIRCGYEK